MIDLAKFRNAAARSILHLALSYFGSGESYISSMCFVSGGANGVRIAMLYALQYEVPFTH